MLLIVFGLSPQDHSPLNVRRNEKVDPFPVVAPSVAELCNKHLTPHCAYFRDEGCLHEDLRYPLAAIEEALLRYIQEVADTKI